MVVGVGSLSDPANMQGLSHYLEHMLFMGSEKFPDENDYDSFLSKNGGGSNAYTELVRRVYCRRTEEPCSNHKRSNILCKLHEQSQGSCMPCESHQQSEVLELPRLPDESTLHTQGLS